MALVAITDEQRNSIRNNPRLTGLIKTSVKNYSSELIVLAGTTGNLDTLTPIEWAKRRFIAKGIILQPNSQDWETWYDQFLIAIAGVVIWDNVANTEDAAINTIIAAGPNGFRSYVRIVFGVRAEIIQF